MTCHNAPVDHTALFTFLVHLPLGTILLPMPATRAQTTAASSKRKGTAGRVARRSTTAGRAPTRTATAGKSPATSPHTSQDGKVKAPAQEHATTDTLTEYDDITNPTEVTGPVAGLVHDKLTLAWAVDIQHPMHFIFDVVNPARVFHIQRKRDDGKNFVTWTKTSIQLSSEEDPPPHRQQFEPKPYR